MSLSFIRIFVLSLFASVFFTACETVVDPVGLPYVERLVVRGVVNTGQPIDSIQVTRTLPLTEKYTREKAAVTDALVTVSVGGQSYLLQSIGSGYYGNRALTAQAGETYRLVIDWHGKHATATTVAPFPVLIDTAYVNPDTSSDSPARLRVRFTPRGNQVYGLGSRQKYYRDSTITEYYETGLYYNETIARNRDTLADGTIWLESRSSFINYEGIPSGDSLFAILYTFDEPFYDYYQTYDTDQPNDNGPFSSGGETIAWNVEGDGIGMFIGRAKSEHQVRR